MSVPTRAGALGELLQRPDLWRGTPASAPSATALPTGHAALDALLPGGGWPLGALTELCHAHAGMGELRVIMPALAQLTRARRWVALVGAPHPFHAPALAAAGLDLERVVVVEKSDTLLWAAEQALRSGACGAVVVWPQRIDDRGLRRLQLAAEAGRNWGVALRPLAAVAQASPAALRLQVESGPRVRVLKCRGATRPAGITEPLFPSTLRTRPSHTRTSPEIRPGVELIPARGFALPPAPRRTPPIFLPARPLHALAGARISAPGTGCPR